MSTYPDCTYITRRVNVGGFTKTQLLQKLHQSSILMNEYGEKLVKDENFITSSSKYSLNTIELTVMDLGFPNGATTAQLYERASELGLELGPLELGPHLRLQYLDQPEGDLGDNSQKNTAPSGSITIATNKLSKEEDSHQGFYLRKIKNELWLRGYTADYLHEWKPEDHFIFVKPTTD